MHKPLPLTIPEPVCDLLDQIIASYKNVLRENLVGLYVHGSLAFGCFRWQKSDIDFIVVVRSPLTKPDKLNLIQTLVDLSPSAPPKGLEMSVILADVCKNFIHPTPYELHFSIDWLERAQADPKSLCGDEPKTDPDLAAHFTVISEVGIAWYGLPVEQVFGPVPREAYLDSLERDLKWASEEPISDPTYLVLNLCRVEAFKKQGLVLSKAQGAEWALKRLPTSFQPLIKQARENYIFDQPVAISDQSLTEFLARISTLA